jgi:HPt (histidine-containing phosphotransfer) domain-containing protein
MANNEEKMALLDNIETVEAQIEQAEELINDLRKELDQLKAEAEGRR